MRHARRITRGILLAGGAGTRLYPATIAISKQLLPVYDKPMVYYPLSALMLAGIREILLITAPDQADGFKRLLGDGQRLGLDIQYAVQPRPEGIAQALLIGREFLRGEGVALVLGDNLFYGHALGELLERAAGRTDGATIFAHAVKDPTRYGVVELDHDGAPLAIEEKPPHPRSHWAVTGIYFYDHRACDIAAELRPSPRGELEITDLNRAYLQLGELHVERLGRGYAWLDTGTHESLLQASSFVQAIEERQGLKIACLEEIAFRQGFIDRAQLAQIASEANHPYALYLRQLLQEPAGRRNDDATLEAVGQR